MSMDMQENTETIQDIWDNVKFVNGHSKICGRQPLKNFKSYDLVKQIISLQIFNGCFPQILFGPFLNTLPHITMYGNAK